MLTLAIVIPAYNEQERLPSTLDRLIAFLDSQDNKTEVLIVDDGSSDRTADIVNSYTQRQPYIRLLKNPGNRGKGYAVRNGMLAASAEWVLFSDADLSSPLEEVAKLFDAVRTTGAHVAIGSRALNRDLVAVHQSWWREQSGRIFNTFMRIITGLPFHDTQCGFKLFHSSAAKCIFARQTIDGFSFDVEDLMIAKLHGIKVVEVPVRWSNVEGTKVALLHGLQSFVDVLRIRWNAARGRYR